MVSTLPSPQVHFSSLSLSLCSSFIWLECIHVCAASLLSLGDYGTFVFIIVWHIYFPFLYCSSQATVQKSNFRYKNTEVNYLNCVWMLITLLISPKSFYILKMCDLRLPPNKEFCCAHTGRDFSPWSAWVARGHSYFFCPFTQASYRMQKKPHK